MTPNRNRNRKQVNHRTQMKEEQEGEEGEEGEEAEEGEEGEAGEEEDDSEAGEAELLDFRELEGLDIPELKMPEGAGDLSPWDWDTMFGQALEDDKYGRNDDESSGDDEQENEEVEEMAKAPVVKSAKKAKASKKLKKVEVEEAGEEEAQTAGEEEEEEVVSSSKAGGGVEASGEGEEEEETSAGEGGWEGEGEQSLGEEEEGEEEIDVDKEWGAGEELNLDEATLDFKMRMDAGLDPAPFVTLRLTDNEDTLAVWPHKFELLYKITIMEDDDFPSILPKADGPSVDLSEQLFNDGPDGLPEGSADGPSVDLSEQLFDDGPDGLPEGSVQRSDKPADGPSVDLSEQLFDDGPDGLPGGSVRRSDKKVRPGSGDPEKRIYRDLGLAKDAEDQFPDDGGIVAEEDPESLDPFHESLIDDVPTQLRLNFVLRNLDEEGSQPMQVQVAALASIATLDQTRHGDFIKVLGLGGGNTLDYTEDSRAPRLDASEDDYLYFGGDRVDKTYVGAAQADVKMCPGNRTHYDLLPRFGFQDVIARQGQGYGTTPSNSIMRDGDVIDEKGVTNVREWITSDGLAPPVLPEDPVVVSLTMGALYGHGSEEGFLVFELSLAPSKGWGAPWWPAVYVLVVLASIIICTLFFFMLKARRQKSWLLYSLLPKKVVKALRSGRLWSQNSDCCVIFADVVSFTSITSTMSVDAVGSVVGELFSIYEDLCRLHGVAKIDIIGDCFMAATGLDLGDTEDPAEKDPLSCASRAASLALDMVESCRQVSEIVSNRLRQAGKVGKSMELKERGEVELRGRGKARTWWLSRPEQGRGTTSFTCRMEQVPYILEDDTPPTSRPSRTMSQHLGTPGSFSPGNIRPRLRVPSEARLQSRTSDGINYLSDSRSNFFLANSVGRSTRESKASVTLGVNQNSHYSSRESASM
eukprot:gene22373-29477_t